jgi:NitT/TauT family transport system permease protein
MRTILFGQLGFFGFIAFLWWLAVKLAPVNAAILPPIREVLDLLWEMLRDPAFQDHLGVTVLRIAVAFVIAVPIALTTGFILGEKLRLARTIMPYIYLKFAVPQSIFLPLFILAFGVGFVEKVIFGFTHAYFVIVVNTFSAVRSVPARYVVAARSFGASRRQMYLRIYLPAMLPLVITGLRLGLIFCILGVLLAEMYASRTGIGKLIFGWGEAYQVAPLMAGVLLVSVLTVLINEIFRLAEIGASRRYASSKSASR